MKIPSLEKVNLLVARFPAYELALSTQIRYMVEFLTWWL